MKYIIPLKKFESDNELLKSLKSLSSSFGRLKMNITPSDFFEDYFLEFKETEGFNIKITKSYIISIELNKLINLDIVEGEFNRILNKLNSIKDRIEKIEGYSCHFMFTIGGKNQSNLNKKTHKNDDYEFKGIGDNKNGYLDGVYYSFQDEDKISKNTTPFNIRFFLANA